MPTVKGSSYFESIEIHRHHRWLCDGPLQTRIVRQLLPSDERLAVGIAIKVTHSPITVSRSCILRRQ